MKLSISLRGHFLSETSGTCGFHRRDERPVLRVRGALFDPALEQFFLLGLELAVRIGRRHHFRFVVGRDAAPEFALLGVAGDDRRDVVVFGEGGFGECRAAGRPAGLFRRSRGTGSSFRRGSGGCRG